MRRYEFTLIVAIVVMFCFSDFSLAINRISLSQVQASFIGEKAGDWADIVACVGDVNGDGYDDFLVGADRNDYAGEDAGQVYLILGQHTGWSLRTSLSEADASFIGEMEKTFVGTLISGAGDVNGDGYDDILIGYLTFFSPGYEGPDYTYVIFGKADGWQMRTPVSEADASFVGENEGDWSSFPGKSVGDVNGDGYDDILIGAPFNSFSGHWAGETYLIFGKPEGWRMGKKLSLADASFVGEREEDWSGYVVAGAGDVNGDGYDDFLISSYKSEDATGQTYLFWGKVEGWSMRTSLSEADASFIGEEKWDYAGGSLSGAGDMNGDGYDDFLVGADRNDYGGEDAGQVYVIFGKPAGWSMRTPLSQADASFIGEREENYAGDVFGVAGVGDVNGDGYDDILIGAPGYDNSRGQTYLILGRPEGWQMRMSLSEADVSFIGEDSLDWSGESLSGGGDVNGDGYDDILIGALGSNEWAGQVYLCLHIPVTITTRSLRSGAAGVPYIEGFSATGGTPPYVWSLHSGRLPDGLGLDSTGVISGVPTSVDTADFTVKVADAVLDTNSKGFTIRIRETTKGDVNGDGQINILDVVFAVNIIFELYDPTPTQFWAADCNEDEIINIVDVIGLVNVILDIGTCPP